MVRTPKPACLMLPILCLVAGAAPGSSQRLAEFESLIDPARIQAHLGFLGADEQAGRAVGSPGADHAASYLAAELRSYGLQPPDGTTSYFQPVPLRGSLVLPGSRLEVTAGTRTILYRLGDDYLLYREGAETLVPSPTPLVFAGYGIVAPEFDYNSYQGIDVAGKIVVLLSGEPASNRPDYFDGNVPTVYAHPEAKHRMALARGARGTILVGDAESGDDAAWERQQRDFGFEHVISAASAVGGLSLLLRHSAAVPLFEDASLSLAEVFGQEARGDLPSFPLNVKLRFHGEFRQREFLGRNVIGIIPGTDRRLRNSHVILGAHYDGLGVGPRVGRDEIYNGVLDNALGVSLLLELARILNSPGLRPRRSVIILFPTAEEQGLLGSRWYTSHPVRPLYRTVAFLNLDGAAFMDRFHDVLGVGAELSSLAQVLQKTVGELGLEVAGAPSAVVRREAFNRSDQAAFAEAGVPALMLMEGFRYRDLDPTEAERRLRTWNESIYHSPFDDLNQTINLDAARQHGAVFLALALNVASAEPPEWKSGVPYLHARLQSIAEKR